MKLSIIRYITLITTIICVTLFVSGIIIGMMGQYYFKEETKIIEKNVKCYDSRYNEIKDASCIEEEIIEGKLVQLGLSLIFISLILPILSMMIIIALSGCINEN